MRSSTRGFCAEILAEILHLVPVPVSPFNPFNELFCIIRKTVDEVDYQLLLYYSKGLFPKGRRILLIFWMLTNYYQN